MKVCIFGATGATGLWLTKMLLDQGHHVTVYVRHLNKLAMNHDLLQVVQGEIDETKKITKVLEGQEAVISCLGSNTTKKSTQLTDMAISISTAMKAAGIHRMIYMATAGIEDEFKGFFKVFIRMVLGHVIDDHGNAANIYKSEGFNYTIVRPVQLKDGEPTGVFNETLTGLPDSKKGISRSNVAMFIVKALEDKTYDHTSVGLTE